ncbi:uncharacterized protein LOC119679069 isoform X1 [Teleopsis dalmanni]|uniref:uncharacterized protein LOC119679069 isoform X1 n=1 Tax=Teleopsis dalmanni TaxID=139649 RepID=UPI0018CFCA66|nr:uncharacterized protein LOC119679069 isoform X1 [Teleopsis dalmanni]
MSGINAKLIAAVFAKPLLWDQKNKDYYNRYISEKKWNEIAKQLKTDVNWVRKRWKQLRDTFRLELKKLPPQQLDDLGADESYSSWPYFNHMLFIKTQIKSRKANSNFSKQNVIREDYSVKDVDFNEYEDNNSSNDMEIHIAEKQSMSNKRKYYDTEISLDVETLKTLPETQKKCKSYFNKYSNIRNIEEKNIKEKKSKNKIDSNDEDMAFFISLLPHVKNMTPPQKLLCRMEIQATVFNHVYGKGSSSSSITQHTLSLNEHNTIPISSYANTRVHMSMSGNNECDRVITSPERQTSSVPTQYPFVEYVFSPKQEEPNNSM